MVFMDANPETTKVTDFGRLCAVDFAGGMADRLRRDGLFAVPLPFGPDMMG